MKFTQSFCTETVTWSESAVEQLKVLFNSDLAESLEGRLWAHNLCLLSNNTTAEVDQDKRIQKQDMITEILIIMLHLLARELE